MLFQYSSSMTQLRSTTDPRRIKPADPSSLIRQFRSLPSGTAGIRDHAGGRGQGAGPARVLPECLSMARRHGGRQWRAPTAAGRSSLRGEAAPCTAVYAFDWKLRRIPRQENKELHLRLNRRRAVGGKLQCGKRVEVFVGGIGPYSCSVECYRCYTVSCYKKPSRFY